MKRKPSEAKRKTDMKSLLSGAGLSFLGAFFTTFLTTPVNGNTARQKASEMAGSMKNLPSRTKENYQKRKEKFYESGHIRYELIHGEMDELKKEARLCAADQPSLAVKQ